MRKRLVTGGYGFIGSHFIKKLLKRYPEDLLVNLDLLTYAGKEENLEGVESENYAFIHGDICDFDLVQNLFNKYGFDEVINFAAESHVDRSILKPDIFIQSNTVGTLTLFNCAYQYWKNIKNYREEKRFLQISTDEVYGSILEGSFGEDAVLKPSSPYSASKASADMVANAYYTTFGIPILMTRCSNNYGPFQDPEKLIPMVITRALENNPLRVFGDGLHVRDWIHVDDHCEAILKVLEKGRIGEIYNVGTGNHWKCIDLLVLILKKLGKSEDLIEYVTDRLGHDRRYAINSNKIRSELGWEPKIDFQHGIDQTIGWYQEKLEHSEPLAVCL